jgi:hypothetical protein
LKGFVGIKQVKTENKHIGVRKARLSFAVSARKNVMKKEKLYGFIVAWQFSPRKRKENFPEKVFPLLSSLSMFFN